MKKLLLILLLVSIIFSACKKEDEGTIYRSPPIIGAWTINSFILESDTNTTILLSSDPLVGLQGGPTAMEFISSGILYQTIGGSIDTNEWVIIGDSLYINGTLPVSYMQEVSDTNLILVAAITPGLLIDWHTVTFNGTRD
jgi:hypothetical protein